MADREALGVKLGSLCTGILGLDRAVMQHFSAELAWYSEIEPAPITVIEREHPDVPNLGDLKALRWRDVRPVDVLTAGYPCQPFSHAGKRKGHHDSRHLWPFILDGVRALRPRYVVLENVRGHLTLGFDTVLRDLAEARFDAEWCLLRASDVGAPHSRARLFVVARNTDFERSPATDARGERHGGGQDARLVGHLGREAEGEAPQRQWARQEFGDRGAALAADTDSLAGTAPVAQQGRSGTVDESRTVVGVERLHRVAWGGYEPAIRRWEHVLGRPAPSPVDADRRLSPAFVEWVMGYPVGWVDGLTRPQALKALGNAVVTQQALAALRELAPAEEQAA